MTEKDPDTGADGGTRGLTYKDAGVDIDAGNALVAAIGPAAARTCRDGVLTGLGGFGALFEVPVDRYRKPVLVSGTDGVGTKLTLAIQLGAHDGVGIDLVAMCVNDILVAGAEPLYFLDYYACGRLDVDVATRVVQGIAEGCAQAGCALIGGETAELPGMYQGEDYDLAGFAVGVVDKDEILDGSRVAPGHQLIALASSGPHSNGYSLIRRIIERAGADPREQQLGDRTLAEALMAPTRIYVSSLLPLIREGLVDAAAHITGGGLLENLPRVLPEGCRARARTSSYELPEVFRWLREQGGVERDELFRTFNCGVGMVLAVREDAVEAVLGRLHEAGEVAWLLGDIIAGDPGVGLVD